MTTTSSTERTTANREAAVLAGVRTGLFIGGTWREAEGGATFDVIDPADGSVLTEVADGTVADGARRPRRRRRRAGRLGRDRRRASAARSCAAPSS